MASSYRYLSGFFILIALILMTIIFTLIHPGYNHLERAFSELGALYAPNYILFNLFVFIGLGIANLYFIEQLRDYFEGTLQPITYWTHRLAAISWILTGIFPVSFEINWLYNVHLAGAVSTYIFGGMTLMFYVRHFSRHATEFSFFSLVSVWFLFGVWMAILLSPNLISGELSQLISIFSFFTWQAFFSIKIYRISSESLN